MRNHTCSDAERSSHLLHFLLLCLALSPAGCAIQGADQQRVSKQDAYAKTEVIYQYQPPVAFKHPDQIPLLISEARGLTKEGLESKLTRLARALNVRSDFSRAKLKVAKDGETSVYSDQAHRWKVYPRSGMIKYQDVTVYNKIPRGFASSEALSEERAMGHARELVKRLNDAGVISESEILWDAPHVYFSKLQGSTGRPRRGFAQPQVTKVYHLDTRVFLPRIREGVPVSGDNLRLVFTSEGRLASLNLMWRDLTIGRETYQRRIDMNRAKEQFERSLKVPDGSRVEVSVNELTYFDPSPRDPVAFLEPVYLFVYTVKTPIKEKPGVFSVSKKLSKVIPAIEHGREQLPSMRKARLGELAKRNRNQAHPLRPVIPKVRTEREYPGK